MRDVFVLTGWVLRVIAQLVVLGGQGSNWGALTVNPGTENSLCDHFTCFYPRRDRCDRCEKETGWAVNTLDVPWRA